ncbi:MAG: hypothetical protein WBY88_11185, partial [Desulfosarcina sp.]
RLLSVKRHKASARKTVLVASKSSACSASMLNPMPEPIRKLVSVEETKTPKLTPNLSHGESPAAFSWAAVA